VADKLVLASTNAPPSRAASVSTAAEKKVATSRKRAATASSATPLNAVSSGESVTKPAESTGASKPVTFGEVTKPSTQPTVIGGAPKPTIFGDPTVPSTTGTIPGGVPTGVTFGEHSIPSTTGIIAGGVRTGITFGDRTIPSSSGTILGGAPITSGGTPALPSSPCGQPNTFGAPFGCGQHELPGIHSGPVDIGLPYYFGETGGSEGEPAAGGPEPIDLGPGVIIGESVGVGEIPTLPGIDLLLVDVAGDGSPGDGGPAADASAPTETDGYLYSEPTDTD
jgi:hypothetical protein